MFPIRDNIPSRSTPVVNYLILGITSLVFLAQIGTGEAGGELVERYGLIPARLTKPGEPVNIPDIELVRTPQGIEQRIVERPAKPAAIPPWLTLVSCMFLHGGWLHFLGNMWFLYIFGDNVEDRFGHLGFLLFYLGTGLAAGLAQIAVDPGSSIPTIGASGAIAGVMGSYLLLYPHARVHALLPLFVIITFVEVPAPLFLGLWFLIQLMQGVGSIGGTMAAGVAWWAHIGGFAAGFLVTLLFRKTHWLRPAPTSIPEDHFIVSYGNPRFRGRRGL